jgi:hypothetical protein
LAIHGLGGFERYAPRNAQSSPFPSDSQSNNPRRAAVEALSEAHQSQPVLVLSIGYPAPDHAQTLGEKRVITDTRRILALLAERHGFSK